MILICEDSDVLEHFRCKNSFLDSKIEKFLIYLENGNVIVDVFFLMRPSSEHKEIMLRFIGCNNYSLSYTDQHYFYTVESLKLFCTDGGKFYASFDPYTEEDMISDDDCDVICSERVEAYATSIVI